MISRFPELIANDFAARGSGAFGSIDIHTKLLREQLDALIRLDPALPGNKAFVETYLRRLAPGKW